jgi:hypothetical protein
MTAALSLFEASKEDLVKQLRQEWQDIAKHDTEQKEAIKNRAAEQKKAMKQDQDERRQEYLLKIDTTKADALAKYEGLGLTQAALALAIRRDHSYVSRYLRYERFLKILVPTFPVGTRMTERRFRDYWKERADEPALRQLSGKANAEKLHAYEQAVFQDIMTMIKDGLPASEKPTKPKARKSKASPADSRETKRLINMKRKEVNEIYKEMTEDFMGLIALLGKDRHTIPPDWMALRAKRLKRSFMRLQEALKGEVTGLDREAE